MTPETLAALEKAIAIWERRAGGATDGTFCPLCTLFDKPMGGNCAGCPISKKTGHAQCLETPFWDWRDCTGADETILAAKAEVEFLKSLLPKVAK